MMAGISAGNSRVRCCPRAPQLRAEELSVNVHVE